jgi:thiamine biosynthesis lipoprotein
MKQTRDLMGMPITVEVVDEPATKADLNAVYDYLIQVDKRYSTYKPESEISRINAGLPESEWSDEMKQVLEMCAETRRQTKGYFEIAREGKRDPSGLVKGWAIHNAAKLLADRGFHNYYVEAGGDIQVSGHNAKGQPWSVGIRNPFNRDEIVKSVAVTTEGVATSGTYIRGQHIYDPHQPGKEINDVASLTVVGPNIYEADRFATAAFAMGANGIEFIESRPGLEGYMINDKGIATLTTGFERYVS